MIGGEDYIINFRDTHVLRDYVDRYMRELWADCIVEDESVEDGLIRHYFKDEVAKKTWDADGCTEENQATLVTVYFGAHLTVVTGSGSSIGPELRQNIEGHWCFEGFVRT